MEYVPGYTPKDDYDDMIVIRKYLKHKLPGKYLFKIPTYEYLMFLGWDEVINYDWIQKMLTNNPMLYLTDQNKHIKFEEKVKNGMYHCGQFDECDKIHGYAFVILSNGDVIQGSFWHGGSTENTHFLSISTNAEGNKYTFWDFSWKLEGYVKLVTESGTQERYLKPHINKTYEGTEKTEGKAHRFYKSSWESNMRTLSSKWLSWTS